MIARHPAMVLLTGAALAALAIPVLAQQGGPESLLPEGFGEPAPVEPQPQPTPGSGANSAVIAPPASSSGAQPVVPTLATAPDNGEADEEDAEAVAAKYDLPPNARRSTDRVGPLTPATGGVGEDAFGRMQGQALAGLMQSTNAPFVSRWVSIGLRSVLLSGTITPADIDGADFVAERAWLLLRMGEADMARALVQSVDADQYTARLYAVAMQVYLASADPAGLCPLLPRATSFSEARGWRMAEAFCASFAADQGTASAVLNQAQRRGRVTGIDYRLAEKTVGAGPNSRRSVKIEWDGVDRLTAWRFGLATAMNVEIPEPLYATAGSQLRAWEARAPMLSLARRQQGVLVAGRLGVLSSVAMMDFYAQQALDPDASDAVKDQSDALRGAFAGETIRARLDAMRSFWSVGNAGRPDYGRLVPLARAAAAIPPTTAVGDDARWLIAAMLAGGYDRNAARWASVVDQMDGDGALRASAMIAVGSPDRGAGLSASQIRRMLDSDDQSWGAFLVAALAGLDRMGAADRSDLLSDAGVSQAATTRWARAIESAARRNERGTVMLLAAVGLQGRDWASVPAQHVYHITAALRRVGMEPQARMIAAEAIARL